tara:strand:+ start:459 stop:959 length:501 start_codon:yes stop_codon:yes gene_type:complete
LPELTAALSENQQTDYHQIIRSVAIPEDAFEDFCSWSLGCYTRNCIFENEKFELILLCWEKDQVTPIHDHGGEECWVKVIHGTLKETLYKEESSGLSQLNTTISVKGTISYMIDFMGYHKLENISGHRAMSLHLYAKPIKKCNVFDHHKKTFSSKTLSFDTVSQAI